MDIACHAVRDGNSWLISGVKHYITNAEFADFHLVCCRTGDRGDRNGLSALLVPTNTPGFEIEPMPDMMGNNGPFHGILCFKNFGKICTFEFCMVSGRSRRYPETFLEPVAPSSPNISPWRATPTPFIPDFGPGPITNIGPGPNIGRGSITNNPPGTINTSERV